MAQAEAFIAAVNRHEPDKTLELFTDDGVFEISGYFRMAGKPEIRRILGYDVGVNARLRISDCVVNSNTVTCRLFERNDRLRALGIDELAFQSCQMEFTGPLLARITAVVPPTLAEGVGERWKAFVVWAERYHKATLQDCVDAENRFIYNEMNGRTVVSLMTAWVDSRRSGTA